MGSCGRLVVSVLAGALVLSAQVSVASAQPPPKTTGGVLPNEPEPDVRQKADLLRAKRAGRVPAYETGAVPRRRPVTGAMRISAPPASMTLPSKATGRFVEPLGLGIDDNNRRYVDSNYWNICVAGAATVAVSYFRDDPVTMSGGFREPYGPYAVTTRWDASDSDPIAGMDTRARAYMLFMAMEVEPPSFGRPGIDDFDTYPTHGGSPQGMRDAVNWEISNHGRLGKWGTFFYFVQENSGPAFSPEQMNADIVADIAGAGAAVMVTVDADFLPNWPDLSRPIHHAIVVIGYDNIDDTYTYLDTCGRFCGSKTDGGTHVIPQRKLFRAIQMVGRNDEDGYLITRQDGTPKYPTGAYVW
ncbi:MAG: hypothetical protein QOH61_2720 [Chloroflexota bacterium]|nr:hypothetical protein [Chloroflexota bacterium]